MNDAYDDVTNEHNKIFLNLETEIICDVEKALDIKTRKRDICFIDASLYKFNYSRPETTKESIALYNLNNIIGITQSAF